MLFFVLSTHASQQLVEAQDHGAPSNFLPFKYNFGTSAAMSHIWDLRGSPDSLNLKDLWKLLLHHQNVTEQLVYQVVYHTTCFDHSDSFMADIDLLLNPIRRRLVIFPFQQQQKHDFCAKKRILVFELSKKKSFFMIQMGGTGLHAMTRFRWRMFWFFSPQTTSWSRKALQETTVWGRRIFHHLNSHENIHSEICTLLIDIYCTCRTLTGEFSGDVSKLWWMITKSLFFWAEKWKKSLLIVFDVYLRALQTRVICHPNVVVSVLIRPILQPTSSENFTDRQPLSDADQY